MMEVAPGWSVDVSRGPDWLFIRLHGSDAHWHDASGLAVSVWEMLQQHLAHRLVLELEDLRFLPSSLLGELVKLNKRVQSNGGIMRLSGLSQSNLDTLRLTRLDRCFPVYRTREDAVMGNRCDSAF